MKSLGEANALKSGWIFELTVLQYSMSADLFPNRLKKDANTTYVKCRLCGRDVDEERTEAAAATAMMMMVGSAMPVMKPFAEFHADHPFMYFIRDNESGAILFMGYQAFID